MEKYTVFWVGGPRDGEILKETSGGPEAFAEAVNFATEFSKQHEKEFLSNGGICIVDQDGKDIEW